MRNIIKKLKNSKSIGPDDILTDENPIVAIIKKPLAEAPVPKTLKTSKTISIFKSGIVDDYNNNRSISLLPITEKNLEMIVMNQQNDFLQTTVPDHNLTHPSEKK